MAKKKLWLIICGCIVGAAIVGLAIFLIVTSSIKPKGDESAPTSIDGTWKVVCFTDTVNNPGAKGICPPDQTIVFENGDLTYYREDGPLTGKYVFKSGSKQNLNNEMPYYNCTLSISESDKLPPSLFVNYYSSNVIELVQITGNGYREWKLVWLDGTRTEYTKVTESYIAQSWTAVLKGHEIPNVTMAFTKPDAVAINNNGTPVNTKYTFNELEQSVNVIGVGIGYVVKPADNTLIIVFVDSNTIVTVWEFKLAQG